MKARRWRGEEEAALRALAPLGYREICRVLPHRTEGAIRDRAHLLKVRVRRLRSGHGADRWRGRLPVPPRAHPLVRRLYEAMNRERVLVSEVAERAGLDPGTVSEWRYRRSPCLTSLIAALNVMGLDLAVVARKGGAA